MADVNANTLTTITGEPNTTDSILVANRNTNEGKIIDYSLLADKILDKIVSKQYSTLTTASKLLTGAINELDTDITNMSGAFGWKEYVANYTINASSHLIMTANDFGASTPTGYKPISFASVTTGNNNVVIRAFMSQATGTDTMLVLRNLSTSSQTANATVRIDYCKNVLFGGQLT